MKLLQRTESVFDRVIYLAFQLATAFVVVVVFGGTLIMVAFRHIGLQLMWAFEIVEYSLLWITILTMAWGIKENTHIQIDLVVSQLKPKTCAVFNIIISTLGALSCGILTWYSFQYTWRVYQIGYTINQTPLEPLLYPIVVVIPVGSFLATLQFLRNLYSHIKMLKAS